MGCNDCNNLQEGVCSEFGFRAAVLRILCAIEELLSTESGDLAVVVPLPQVTLTAAEIESDYTSYADTGLLDSQKKLKYWRIINTTDANMEFSIDGGTSTYITVMSGTTYDDNLSSTFTTATKIRMRRVSGMTASNGQVLIEGRY